MQIKYWYFPVFFVFLFYNNNNSNNMLLTNVIKIIYYKELLSSHSTSHNLCSYNGDKQWPGICIFIDCEMSINFPCVCLSRLTMKFKNCQVTSQNHMLIFLAKTLNEPRWNKQQAINVSSKITRHLLRNFIVSMRQIYNFFVWFRRAKRGLRVRLFLPISLCVC